MFLTLMSTFRVIRKKQICVREAPMKTVLESFLNQNLYASKSNFMLYWNLTECTNGKTSI